MRFLAKKKKKVTWSTYFDFKKYWPCKDLKFCQVASFLIEKTAQSLYNSDRASMPALCIQSLMDAQPCFPFGCHD